MYIPTSLWESTRDLKYQIFEAMEAYVLASMMKDAFTQEKEFLVRNCKIEGRFLFCENNLECDLNVS
jgi:hypothetical protein